MSKSRDLGEFPAAALDIDAAGNLDVTGTVTADGLVVGGTGTGDGDIALKRSYDGLTVGNVTVDSAGSRLVVDTAYSYIDFETEGTNFGMRISNGNVGVGTSSPAHKFVVAEGTDQHGVEIVPGFLSYIQAYDRATSDYGDLKIDSKTIAFGTNNGSERMRIDSAGNALFNCTTADPSGGNVFGSALLQYGGASMSRNNTAAIDLNRSLSDGDIAVFRKDGTTVGSISSNNGNRLGIGSADTGLLFVQDADDIIPYNMTTGIGRDNAIDLGQSGNRFKDLHLSGTANIGGHAKMGNGYSYGWDDLTTRISGNSSTDLLNMYTAGSERLRIDSSGNLLVGKTSVDNTTVGMRLSGSIGFTSMVRDSDASLLLNRLTSDGEIMLFRKDNTAVGSVSVTASGTTYNTTSDRRLKKDIQPISNSTDKLMAMNPVTHGWKADPEADTVYGFIAQEMMDIVPEAVSGDPEGEEMMSMDYGRITPVIVAALQEANKKIAELENRLNALEGK